MFLLFKFYFRQSFAVAQADLALSMYIQAGLKHVAVLSLLSARIMGMNCLPGCKLFYFKGNISKMTYSLNALRWNKQG